MLHFWTNNFSISPWEKLNSKHVHDFPVLGFVHDTQKHHGVGIGMLRGISLLSAN